MNGIVEVAIVAAIVMAIARQSCVRQWLKQLQFNGISKSECWFAATILVLLLFGQIANLSRTTFPFVRWSMYTEPFEDQPIVVSKFEAVHFDGSTRWVNLAQHYPSISRNFDQTLSVIFQLKLDGKLPAEPDAILDEFLLALGDRYQNSIGFDSRNPVIELRGVLQRIKVENGKCQTDEQVVTAVQLKGRPYAVASAGRF